MGTIQYIRYPWMMEGLQERKKRFTESGGDLVSGLSAREILTMRRLSDLTNIKISSSLPYTVHVVLCDQESLLGGTLTVEKFKTHSLEDALNKWRGKSPEDLFHNIAFQSMQALGAAQSHLNMVFDEGPDERHIAVRSVPVGGYRSYKRRGNPTGSVRDPLNLYLPNTAGVLCALTGLTGERGADEGQFINTATLGATLYNVAEQLGVAETDPVLRALVTAGNEKHDWKAVDLLQRMFITARKFVEFPRGNEALLDSVQL